MPDLLQKASAWLEDQRTRHLTQSVVYQRGSVMIDVPATLGTTVFELDNGAGALLRVESRDYLIRAADLVVGGQGILPQRGDRIRESSGSAGEGQVRVYEVVGPGHEPCWRWSDPYRQTLRIHTTQVDSEPGGA